MSAPGGAMFGDYRIARPIGSGGFSTVYLAHDDRLDAAVAVKVLAENRALDMDARRRFIEEAQKLRKVQSSVVVTVYDVGETKEKQPFMVLEYADRGDLAERPNALTRPIVVDGHIQVVDFLQLALSALHNAGLVHRDVKPHNILIRTSHGSSQPDTSLLAGNERLLLGDLGFVKDLSMASGLTVGGGTWAYQAPEQRLRMGSVDIRADIFSASAVIAWLIVGREPSEGEYWPSLLEQTTVSPAVKAELLKGMAESPEDRHPDMEQWRTALREALQPAPISAPPVALPQNKAPVDESERSVRRRYILSVAAAVMALIAVGSFAGGWTLAGADEPTRVAVADGNIRTETTIGDGTARITGPDEVAVGDSERFTSELSGDLAGWWVYPDGSLVEIEGAVDSAVFVADTPGTFVVTLIVAAPESDPELLIHRVQAIE